MSASEREEALHFKDGEEEAEGDPHPGQRRAQSQIRMCDSTFLGLLDCSCLTINNKKTKPNQTTKDKNNPLTSLRYCLL